jgi:hypothetical protein
MTQTAQSVNMELKGILDEAGENSIAYSLRCLMLDYIASNIKGGLPFHIEQNLPALNHLISFIEYLEDET